MARVIILLPVIFSLLNLHLSTLPKVMVEGAIVVTLRRGSSGRWGSSRGGGQGSSRGGGGSPRRGSGGGRGTTPLLVGARAGTGVGVAAGWDGGRYHRSSNNSAATEARCAHAGRTARIGIIAGVAALLMSY